MTERDLIDELLRAKVKSKLFGGEHAPRLGRLVILEPLGSGAMGTVFAAYDPRLDRKVAVKLLKSQGSEGTRVLREARVLGKLNHPNVVAVYDATENDGVISIVMELAPGRPLRQWVGAGEPWREIVAVMREAALGLAAAHRAGVVHRDVKPDNVVVGPDRSRLVDFGLAGASGDGLEGSGTPGYMAPEVLAGAPASAASDQYAFAVTLAELLYGARPTPDAPPERRARVPLWLHRVVLRALAPEPAARFESMDALALALGRERRSKRTALLALALIAFAVALGYQRGTSRDLCGGGRARVEASFAPAELDRLRAGLGVEPWAKKAADDFAALLGAWEKSHRRVCEATRVQGGQPEPLLDLRMRCLDRRFTRISALGARLGGALDAEARGNVSDAVVSLPRPEPCETLTEAAELVLPDQPERRARVLGGEKELDRAWSAYALGHYREAREQAAPLEASTRDLGFAPFRAELSLLVGSVEARLGGEARPHLEAALRAAAEAGAARVEHDAWTRLLRGELFEGRSARVVEWTPFARVAAARAGVRGAELDGIEGEARREAGDMGEARRLLTRALSNADELRGDQRALIEMNLGSVELAGGNPVAAEAAFARALGLAETALGKEHPGLGLYLDKLALSARDRGRLGEALTRHDRALELRQRVYGEGDRAVATTLLRRAQTRLEAGKLRLADEDLERARAIRVSVHGAHHRRVAEVDLARCDVATARGERARALELYESASALDPTLDASPRRVVLGAPVEASSIPALAPNAELSVEAARQAAARVAVLASNGDPKAAIAEAEQLRAAWRARGPGVAAAISNEVAEAERRVGANALAAGLFEAALSALADEPGRERLRALVGLASSAEPRRAKDAATAALGLLDAMPELDAALRPELKRAAER